MISLKPHITFLAVFLLSYNAQAVPLVEFNDHAVRIHLATSDGELRKLSRILRYARSFHVFRKSSKERKYQEIFSSKFPRTVEELKQIIQTDKKETPRVQDSKSNIEKKETTTTKLKTKSNPELKAILNKSKTFLIFSIYSLNQKVPPVLGIGFWDNNVKKELTYRYYVVFKLRGNRKIRFPGKPIRAVHRNPELYSPVVKKIEPIENGSKIFFKPSSKALTRSAARSIVIGYNIYRIQGNDKPVKINKKLIANVRSSKDKGRPFTFADKGLKHGKKISYYVTSVSFGGFESKTDKMTIFHTRSLKTSNVVQNVKTKIVDAGVRVSWSQLLDSEVIGYNVYRGESDKSDAKFTKVNRLLVPASLDNYIDVINLKPLQRIVYRIGAVNKWGNESPLSPAGFVTYKAMESPPPPEKIQVTSGKKGTFIKWQKPDFSSSRLNPGHIKGYVVYRSFNRTDNARSLSRLLPPNQFSFHDKRSLPQGGYWYTVRSLTRQGVYSIYPAPVFIKTLDFSVARSPGFLRYYKTQKGILFHWQRPNAVNLGGYRIFLKKKDKWIKIHKKDISKNKTRYLFNKKNIAKPAGAKKMAFRIHSVNSQGKLSADFALCRIKGRKQDLTPPVGVKAFLTRRGVRFIWLNEANVKGINYFLYRKRSGEKKFTKVKKSGAGKMFLTDTMIPGKEHLYFLAKKDAATGEVINSRIYRVTLPK